MTMPMPIDLTVLQDNLDQAGVDVSAGIGMDADDSDTVYTYDADGTPIPLPPAADPIIEAFFAEVR